MRERRVGVLEQHVAAADVAGVVLRQDLPDRVPRADVRPAGVERHDHALAQLRLARERLHHRVVDRVRRRRGERVAIDAEEVAVLLAVRNRLFAGRMDLGLEPADRVEPHRRAHDEDPAVPPVFARFDVLPREFEMRLLDEAVEAAHVQPAGGRIAERRADADVAVARLRARRHDPHRRDLALRRAMHAGRDGRMKARAVRDGVVGGHHRHHRIAAVGDDAQRGERQRRRRIAAERLEHDRRALAGHAQLLGGREAMILAAHDQHVVVDRMRRGQTVEAQRGGLQQRMIAEQADQLLRIVLARHRPQARAGTAGENHRLHRDAQCGVGCGGTGGVSAATAATAGAFMMTLSSIRVSARL
jgi:hypothetical protein